MTGQINGIGQYADKLIDNVMVWGPNFIGALIVLVVGLYLVKTVTRCLGSVLEARKLDPSLVPFVKHLTNIVLKILVIFSVMGMIGIQMTSFIALLGAAGLAFGLALSGTLQDFAGGVILLIFRPFNVGDFIEAQGCSGTVKEISIFTTILHSPDNRVLIIPNGPLATKELTNYSKEPTRRVDWKFGIAYGDDIENFKKAIHDFVSEDSRILNETATFIGLSELGDNSVNLAVRVWVKTPDYWDVFFDMNEKVYKRLKDYNLNIPFPQMDVHIHNK